jgi:hypothetical protein
MNRPLTITEANGRVTAFEYTDSTTPKLLEKVLVESGKERKVETTFDRLNRPVLVKLFDPPQWQPSPRLDVIAAVAND